MNNIQITRCAKAKHNVSRTGNKSQSDIPSHLHNFILSTFILYKAGAAFLQPVWFSLESTSFIALAPGPPQQPRTTP